MKKVLYILGLLEDEDIDWLVSSGHRDSMNKGEVLITENEYSGNLFIIVDGSVDVTVRGKKIAEVTTGEVVGEMSLLDSRPPSATITANESLLVLRIDFKDLEARMASNHRFAARLYKALGIFLAQRLRNINLQLTVGEGTEVDEMDEDEILGDEIDESVLENISLAGARFKMIIEKLKNA